MLSQSMHRVVVGDGELTNHKFLGAFAVRSGRNSLRAGSSRDQTRKLKW